MQISLQFDEFFQEQKFRQFWEIFQVWLRFQIPLVKEACPEIKIIFNTRLPRTSNTSFYQVVKGHVYTDSLSYDLKTWWKYFSFPHHFYTDPDGPYANFKKQVIDKLSQSKMEKFAVGSFAASLLCYLENKDKAQCLKIT